jgi:tRNA pseudouridine55 synthase
MASERAESRGDSRGPRRRVDGIVLLDKPVNLSSNHALQRVRHALAAAKAGHAGTLDPMATGMLPLCFGQATKICGMILGSHKAYRARLRLGVATDTGDAQGATVRQASVPSLDTAAVADALGRFLGESEQVPPMVSALKLRGERLYELARRGESVPRPARRIELHRIELLRLEGDEIEFEVECSKGTYVRVLAEDVAARLGTVGHLIALHRLWVAPFVREPMVSLEEVLRTSDQVVGVERPTWLRPLDSALVGLARVDLGSADSAAVRHGRAVRSDTDLAAGTTVRAYDAGGELLGLLEVAAGNRLQVLRLLTRVDP